MKINDCVTILGHVGIIDDVAKSEKGKTLILWRSLKGVWNHHTQEWLDVTDTIEHIRLATMPELNKDIEYYAGHCINNAENEMRDICTQSFRFIDGLSLADKGE